jgi:DNA invertase Pin-like site-specific DNA recombinase
VLNRWALRKGVFLVEKKTVEVLWPKEKEDTVKESVGKLRVAAYCRLSRQSGDKQINSLENQLKYYTHYIRSHDEYKLVGLYYDKDISGVTIDGRPGFKRLLRHCDEGLIDLVLTKSISRFSRNAKDLLEVVDHLSDLGIPVIFEKENISSMERKNKFFLTALAAVSQDEIVNIAHNSRWGQNKRILSGNPTYRRQFGYKIVKTTQGQVAVIHEEEAEVIKEVFELFLGGMKIGEILKLLTDRGVKTVSGHTIWSHTLILNILENRSYIGEKITNQYNSSLSQKVEFLKDCEKDMYLLENAYPRIISNEYFEKAQKKLLEQRTKRKSGVKLHHSCSRRISCGLCDVKYHKNRKKNHVEWVCSVKQKQARLCDSPRLTDKKILKLMKEIIRKRYDFNNSKILEVMKNELTWVNKNDRFELHRLSLLSKLQIAKENQSRAPEDESAIIEKEKVEQAIVEFEHLATMIEEDRKYRDLGIELLRKAKSPEDFLERANVDVLRAWIMEVRIFSLEDYQVHWYDDLHTTVGTCESRKKEMELKREQLMGEDLILKSQNKEQYRILVDDCEIKGEEGIDPPFPNIRGETVQTVRVEKYFSENIIDRIRREIRESKQHSPPVRKKVRIAVYARVSTDDPAQLGSLEAQMAYYTYAVLKNPDYRLVKVYYDEGVSGTKAENRQGFQQLISDCRRGKIDRVITKSISRFARNTVDCLEYVRELEALDVSIMFEKEEIDTAEKDGEILLTVYSALAQEESRSLGENLTWGRSKFAERGTVKLSTLPYGFHYGKDGRWEIDSEKAHVVNRIFDEYSRGKSMLGIAKGLTQDNIPSPRNNSAWGLTTVRRVLNNPAYIGDVLYQKNYTSDSITGKRVPNNGELPMYYIEDNHEAIIEKEKWDKVQRIIKSKARKITKAKRHTREEFFKAFQCGVCGCPIVHLPSHKGLEKHYWRCRAATMKNHSEECFEKAIREENIEHTFMTMLLEMKDSKKLSELVNVAIEEVGLKPHEEEELERLENEIEVYYQKLYETVEDGKKHGEDTEAIKMITDHIMGLHDRIRSFEDRKERVVDIHEELKWLRKELLALEPFDPKKERAPFREDIFARLIKSGTFLTDGVIEYQLSIGVSWLVRENRREYWKLPMKK